MVNDSSNKLSNKAAVIIIASALSFAVLVPAVVCAAVFGSKSAKFKKELSAGDFELTRGNYDMAKYYYNKSLSHKNNSKTIALVSAKIRAVDELAKTKVYSCSFDGFVNIRMAANSWSTILGRLDNGPEGAEFISQDGNWTLIKFKGITGYVLSSLIQHSATEKVTSGVTPAWVYGYWHDPTGSALPVGAKIYIDQAGNYKILSRGAWVCTGKYYFKGNDVEFVVSTGGSISFSGRHRVDLRLSKIGNLVKTTLY